MKEKDFQSKFMKWLKASSALAGAFELKLTKTNRFPLSEVRDSQWVGMELFYNKTLSYKIPDEGPSSKPFDCFKMSGDANFVIMFYRRGQKNFVMIGYEELKKLKDKGVKSITEEEAIACGNEYSLDEPIITKF